MVFNCSGRVCGPQREADREEHRFAGGHGEVFGEGHRLAGSRGSERGGYEEDTVNRGGFRKKSSKINENNEKKTCVFDVCGLAFHRFLG